MIFHRAKCDDDVRYDESEYEIDYDGIYYTGVIAQKKKKDTLEDYSLSHDK